MKRNPNKRVPQEAWILARKSKINDCYEVLESIAWIWRSIGIFPLTIKNSRRPKKYEKNVFYAVYGWLICSVCTINYIYAIATWNRDELDMISVNLLMRTLASILCQLASTVWRIFRLSELLESIETIAAQDLVLENSSSPPNHELTTKVVRSYVWTILIGGILLKIYDILAAELFSPRQELQYMLWSIPLIVQALDVTIFVTLVGLLGQQFSALNEKIKSVTLRANASSPMVIVTSDVCAENLRSIARTHYNICVVGKRINSIFSFIVIVNVIAVFIILSTTLYYIFYEIQRDGPTNYVRIGTYIQWELVHTVAIFVIVVVCNWTSHQGTHAGELIHEIRVRSTESRLYETVKSFSLQLHHQNLEFTAGGFFPLNPTLLQAIIGNITTYLVILIQFQPRLD